MPQATPRRRFERHRHERSDGDRLPRQAARPGRAGCLCAGVIMAICRSTTSLPAPTVRSSSTCPRPWMRRQQQRRRDDRTRPRQPGGLLRAGSRRGCLPASTARRSGRCIRPGCWSWRQTERTRLGGQTPGRSGRRCLRELALARKEERESRRGKARGASVGSGSAGVPKTRVPGSKQTVIQEQRIG